MQRRKCENIKEAYLETCSKVEQNKSLPTYLLAKYVLPQHVCYMILQDTQARCPQYTESYTQSHLECPITSTRAANSHGGAPQ